MGETFATQGEWPIVGHEQIVALLRRGLEMGRLSHAYLLTGPPQIGKTTLALTLAQALNCAGDVRPCGACSHCRKIAGHTHPDVRVIEGEGGTLKIDQIRAMQREVSLSPYEGEQRVAIILSTEEATQEAANCLLKTLEEPPDPVTLILTAIDAQDLLPTIVSRCQVLPLRPLPISQVREALSDRWEAGKETADLVARLSGGRIGWAVEAVQDDKILTRRERRLAELADLAHADRVDRLSYADKLSQHPEAVVEVLELWLTWWRDLLLFRSNCPKETITNIDRHAALARQGKRYSLPEIKDFIQAIRRTSEQLQQNVNTQLALEVLLLEMPSG